MDDYDDCQDCKDCQCLFKTFLFLILIGPMSIPFFILLIIAILEDVFVLLYFGLVGWFCEIELCHCHKEFLIEGLALPWKPLVIFLKKIYAFFKKDLCYKTLRK